MTREELKEYAAANRSRLEKQKVELGDLVMILVGRFAGENGVVKGISVCGNDFTDPYYEVDMACEVPDKYKCRKTLIQPNNVIGGLSASDFEVIANRTPEADIKGAEPKPTFHIGDKVVAKISDENIRKGWIGRVTAVGMNFVQVRFANYPSELYNVRMDMLAPYTESNDVEADTDVKIKVGGRVKTAIGMATVEAVSPNGKFLMTRLDGGDGYLVDTTKKAQEPTADEGEEKLQSRLDNADSASSIINILREETVPTPAWQSYRMELAAKIAVAYAEKGRYEPWEIGAKAVEVANGVVERLKNTDI